MTSAPTYSVSLAEPYRRTPAPQTRRTEPLRTSFLRSIMRQRNVDDSDEGVVTYNRHEKKATQEEQDEEDEKARKEAMRNLVNSWQERLQLISVITTFFATTEAAMLVNTKPANPHELENNILKLSNAGFLGSLILHVYASVLSFLGAFLLISYKVREARREEMIMEGIAVVNSPHDANNVERGTIGPPRTFTGDDVMNKYVTNRTAASTPEPGQDLPRAMSYPVEPPVFAANPHIEQVDRFRSNASSPRLLSRIHAVCVFLTAVGFILALIGIVSYAWALQPESVSIFTSVCLGGALLCMLFLFV